MKQRRFTWPVAIVILSLLLAASLALPSLPAVQAVSPPRRSSRDASILFIENAGQFHRAARYQARGGLGTLWLAQDALWLTVYEATPPPSSPREAAASQSAQARLPQSSTNLRLSFADSNPRPLLEPIGRLATTFHYYLGNDPTGWHTNVPAWGGVRYVDLYPGIDLEVTGTGGQWSWRLVARDSQLTPGHVRLRLEGAESAVVLGNRLLVTTAAGEFALPLLTSEGAGVDSQPSVIESGGVITIASPLFKSEPDAALPKNSSPALLFGTYLGGSAMEEAEDIAVDGSGALYATGWTMSSDFPTVPGPAPLLGNADVFVTKLGSGTLAGGMDSGLQLVSPVWSVFLGGTYSNAHFADWITDNGLGIAVAESGEVFVTGYTWSDDFPTTPDAYDTSFGGPLICAAWTPERPCSDAFVTRLDSSGSLAYSTYLGGSGYDVPGGGRYGGDDEARGIAIDGSTAYVTGYTQSGDFPTTPGAYDREYADVNIGLNDDVFVTQLDTNQAGAAGLKYSTFVGGGLAEQANDIALDSSGVSYVTGHADGSSLVLGGSDFPTTPGALDRTVHPGAWDAFVFKLNPGGQGKADLQYSTFLGEEYLEDGGGIAVNGDGAIFVTGHTSSATFPTTPGAFDTICGTDGLCNVIHGWGTAGDAFVSQLAPAGNGAADLLYSTFVGGDNIENFWSRGDIAVDENDDVHITGETWSKNGFPLTLDALDTVLGGKNDAFVTRLSPQGNGTDDLVYSTYLGGWNVDSGLGIALGTSESICVAGATESGDFPTSVDAFDRIYNGNGDGFLACLGVETQSAISGRVLDADGNGLDAIRITAGGTYSATTNAQGEYLLPVPAGTYTVTPASTSYFWSPPVRTVTIPPDAAGQDFVGRNIVKSVTPTGPTTVSYGETLTYTVATVYPQDGMGQFYDAVPTYTAYISSSLAGPAGVTYDPAGQAVSGTVNMTAGMPITVTFSVRVMVTGTAGSAPVIVNRACVSPEGSGLAGCKWSNEVWTYTYARYVHLPIVLRDD